MDNKQKIWRFLDSIRSFGKIDSLTLIQIYKDWLQTGEFNLDQLSFMTDEQKNEFKKLLIGLSNEEKNNLFYIINSMERSNDLFVFEEGEKLAIQIFERLAATDGTVLDIGSGSGHFLREMHHAGIGSAYEGEEINKNAAEIAETLSKLSDIRRFDVKTTDSLTNWNDKQYDMVYSNMPFLGRIPQEVRNELPKLMNKPPLAVAKIGISDWVFMLRIYESLKDNGIGIGIVRGAALNAIRDKEVRRWFIEEKCIKAIIQLPAALMDYTAVPTFMIILDKQDNDRIMIMDASEECVKGSIRNHNAFSDDNIETILHALFNETKISKYVTHQEIAEVDYNLHPQVHMMNSELSLVNPVKLSSIAELIRGRDIDKKTLDADKDKTQAGYLLNLSDIETIFIDELGQSISEELLEANSKMRVKENDLIITSRGSKLRVAIIDQATADKKVIVSSNITIIRPDVTKINPYYLLAYMNSELGMYMINRMNTGSVIFTFTNKKLAEYQVPMLTEEEMDTISDEMKLELANYKRLLRDIKKFNDKLPTIYTQFKKEEY
ncbi:methyltransferase domain-containing protein [Macrococcus brunensis]|uniref:site-specific DNA-methyltransferase (adenine-specific) n=1 Tax=Macrococcus brunensis TaxID=198483 RepID=A0A4R6BB38_9STAP|nr:N-6 DNA methylase [Macrococcus brunensis]TDL94178.1 methyltransferase domain-containing protein [Macrococcus brunensis]